MPIRVEIAGDEDKDTITLTYKGESSKDTNAAEKKATKDDEIWEWIRGALSQGPRRRADLLKQLPDDLCHQRKFDDVVADLIENGLLSKQADPTNGIYKVLCLAKENNA